MVTDPGGITQSFSYDGFGRRVSRTPNGSRIDAWYDQTGLILETGTPPARHHRRPG